MREQALGDAIAAETGTDDPQQRIVAAQLASVHRVLSAEAAWRHVRQCLLYCQVVVSGSMPWARALASMIRRNHEARPARMPS